jgi:Ca-activated chloride channel family protein
MSFAHLNLLFFTLVVPFVVLLGWMSMHLKQKKIKDFADTNLLSELCSNSSISSSKSIRSIFVSVLVTSLIVLAILGPRFGYVLEEAKQKGFDIAIAVDVSESMLATDLAPNRLERSRRALLDLLKRFQGDRIALIAFAGAAFIETPLTQDYAAFRLFLDNLSTEVIPVKGTNIEQALIKSLEALGVSEKLTQSSGSKAIILLTDGESFQGDVSKPRELAKNAGVKIFIIGVGTQNGAPIPTSNGYKKDSSGNVVITRLNEAALTELATATGGYYITSLSSDMDAYQVYDRGIRAALESAEISSGLKKRYREFFQIPLLLAVLILLFSSWSTLPGILKSFLKSRSFTTIAFLLLMALYTKPALAGSPEELAVNARSLYQQGKYSEALPLFEKAHLLKPDDYSIAVGLAASLYREGRFVESEAKYLEAFSKANSPKQKAESLYNAGNAAIQKQEIKEAIEHYENSLKLAPSDKETKDNLAYAKRLLKEQQQKENEKQENKEQKNKDKNDKKDSEDKSDQQNDKQQSDNKDSKNNPEDNKDESDQPKQENDKQNDSENKPEQPKDQPQDDQQKNSGNQTDDSQKNNEKNEEQANQQNAEQPKEDELEPQKEDSPASGGNADEEKADEQPESGGSASAEQDLADAKEEKESAQADTILKYLEENREKLLNYRKQQGLKALGRQAQPQNDW